MRAAPVLAATAVLATTLACGSGDGAGAEEARALVEQAFAAKNQPGAVGVEAVGKGVWYRAEALNAGCLHAKNLAFADKGESPRLTPVYQQQSVFQYATDAGFCIWVGDDLQMKTDSVNKLGDAYIVDAVFEVARPGGWWDCVDERQKRFPVRVVAGPDGALQIEKEPPMFGGACPKPLQLVNPSREGGKRPTSRPPRPPTRDDIVAAARALDEALWAHDLRAALDATACYNLYEEEKFGSCSGGELVNVGPIPRGEIRRSDGAPWTMNAFDGLDAIGRPEADGADKTLFHAEVKPATKKHPRRTISVQWVEGGWRMVGAVQRKSEGLTSVEYVLDLDRREKRDIFERRLKGEDIDLFGNPPDEPKQP